MMEPTNTGDPEYYHRVVDCQWACPAHTDVPGYIRLISQGRFDDAYLLNRQSNVFPGVLGRVCDRPCEPACRRGRVDGDPVAICRLKRVAADLAGDVRDRLPRAGESNGKRVVCVGAGPASLTVANDLAPLGYEVTILERFPRAGGLMRTNIPEFRLPAAVLDDEIAMITEMGVSVKVGHEVDSLAALLAEGYDAVFVGSGAPKPKDLVLPGRDEEIGESHIHLGIEWLEAVAFGHVTSIGARVLIIGVGNTAMDCCRTSLRLGGTEIKVMARRPREYFKASPWELVDAEEEGVEIVVNHAPRRFVVEEGRLTGVEFDVLTWDESARHSEVLETIVIPCDDVVIAVGQENAFPWIERDLGLEFTEWDTPVVDAETFSSTRPGVFFGGDAALGPKNIIWAVAHGHDAALSIDLYCRGEVLTPRPSATMTLTSQQMGMSEWSYHNDYNPSPRQHMNHVPLAERFRELSREVELGFDPEQTAREVQRCLNCDVQTGFRADLCIECDACLDVCPVQCLSIVPNGSDDEVRARLRAPSGQPDEPLYVSEGLPQTGRVMVKDENVCVHCGLCAERCPTAAWDMVLFDRESPFSRGTQFIPISRVTKRVEEVRA